MAEEQDRAQAANEASAPVSTKPEMAKKGTGAKATKWGNAPDVVGEDSGKTGQEDDDKAEAKHGTEDEPQMQAVTDTAGTVNDAGTQEGDAQQVPARAENDPLAGGVEPASNVAAEGAMIPAGQEPPAANERPLDAPDGGSMFRDDTDHPHFAGQKAAGTNKVGSDDPTADAGAPGTGGDDPSDDVKARMAELDAREAEVSRREQAVQPSTSTITDRDVDAQIVGERYVDGATALDGVQGIEDDEKQALGGVTLCFLRLRHGGIVIGSAEKGPLDGSSSDLRGQAKADARAQLDAGLRFSHRMQVAGLR